ncbi:MAG: AraC family transcriptional regulator [Christensenellales bacterium]
MDLTSRLERAVDYIEDCLKDGGEIDLDQAAKLAFSNRNDLSTLFYSVTGTSLSEYIRRRRLSMAALELQSSDSKIIDIALKHGYSSPTAFNRAFQNQHRASPKYARSMRIFINVYPRISFQIKVKGEMSMKCKVEKKPAFKVAGVKKAFRNDSQVNLVPKFWSDLPGESYEKMISVSGGSPKGFLGLCTDFDGKHLFNYYIAVATDQDNTKGLETINIPEATWAVFEGEGELTDLVTRIWKEWFPSSGYRRAGNSIPDVEVYFDYDFPKENFRYELWYPVVKICGD